MDSIFNSKSGVPHIGEKILKCMDMKSILSCNLVNQELRSYMGPYLDNLDPMDFSKRIKSYFSKEISLTNEIPQLDVKSIDSTAEQIKTQKNNNEIIQEFWLPLIEIMDEKKLWNHEVKKQFYLCMIRILHQENCFPRRIPSFKFSSWHMDEIIDSAIGKK